MERLIPFLLISILIFTACEQNGANNQVNSNENSSISEAAKEVAQVKNASETECRVCDFDFENYKGELNKEEVNGLLLALNDEYMAWATYDQINKDLGNPRPFVNIQPAEALHAERLKTLFTNYKIPIPENKWIGITPKFESVADACKAGVDAEIANRDLYTELFKSTTRNDILIVYKLLQRASDENHLPAFQRCGSGGGPGRRGPQK